ncbi:hypothetical protein BVX93_01615 [bacterium B13(2017)]|nr:hypothetical protein BVX93_01615 [bacterium B13(2017)]
MKGNIMKSKKDEIRPEYDFEKMKNGIRGKYAKEYKKGTNVVLLAPDVANVFHNSKLVNEALRSLIKISKKQYAHSS